MLPHLIPKGSRIRITLPCEGPHFLAVEKVYQSRPIRHSPCGPTAKAIWIWIKIRRDQLLVQASSRHLSHVWLWKISKSSAARVWLWTQNLRMHCLSCPGTILILRNIVQRGLVWFRHKSKFWSCHLATAVLGKPQIGGKISMVTGPWQSIEPFLYSGIRNFLKFTKNQFPGGKFLSVL